MNDFDDDVNKEIEKRVESEIIKRLGDPKYLQKLLIEKSSDLIKAKTIIQDLQPKGEFYDDVTGSDEWSEMTEIAKVLNFPDYGRNRIFKKLRKEKILRYNNEPYQEYVDRGYFRLIEQKIVLPYGSIKINYKTVVSQKGLDFIRKILRG